RLAIHSAAFTSVLRPSTRPLAGPIFEADSQPAQPFDIALHEHGEIMALFLLGKRHQSPHVGGVCGWRVADLPNERPVIHSCLPGSAARGDLAYNDARRANLQCQPRPIAAGAGTRPGGVEAVACGSSFTAAVTMSGSSSCQMRMGTRVPGGVRAIARA